MKNRFKWSLLAVVAIVATVAMAADKYISSSGNIVLKTSANKSVNLQDTLYTTQAGSVGIGTSTPATMGIGGTPTIVQIHQNSSGIANLTLSNNSTASGTASGGITMASTGMTGADKRFSSLVSIKEDAATDIPKASMAFYTANNSAFTEKVRIRYDGRVGIGTTTPAQKLQVNGAVDASGGITNGHSQIWICCGRTSN